MKLSSLYSNDQSRFERIDFREGLNVVLAEIRVPENRSKDTHNLGKTTLGRLIDFCLLQQRDNKFFLFKHLDRFEDFVFYLEVAVGPGNYVTIRRSVEEPSKISFARHASPRQDFTTADETVWDHWRLSFERSRLLLDGYLDLEAIKPWEYRKILGYVLRSQQDYSDVFQLDRFRGAHADWKPFVAQILGFEGPLISQLYTVESNLELKANDATRVQVELGGSMEDFSKIAGLLLLRTTELNDLRSLVEAFDFRAHDKNTTKKLVDEIDFEIAELNQQRYGLTYSQRRIIDAIGTAKVDFDTSAAADLLAEVNISFEGQLRRNFSQLVEFNQRITEERRGYLQEELTDVEAELSQIDGQLEVLGARRARALEFLRDTDVYNRFKRASGDLVELEADVLALSRRREHLHELQTLRAEVRRLEEERDQVVRDVEVNVESVNDFSQDSMFTQIRLYFDSIVKHVIERNALLTVALNRLNHPEFDAGILDEAGEATSADAGFTYRKLLCLAFDLAVLRAHLGEGFPHFAFHDGVFEVLDPRKRGLLMEMVRIYVNGGLQHIVTVVDTDLPRTEAGEVAFQPDEVVLRLHDEGESGRLFKMPAW